MAIWPAIVLVILLIVGGVVITNSDIENDVDIWVNAQPGYILFMCFIAFLAGGLFIGLILPIVWNERNKGKFHSLREGRIFRKTRVHDHPDSIGEMSLWACLLEIVRPKGYRRIQEP